MNARKTALVLAAGSAAALVAMVVVALTTGATQEAYEYVIDPAAYAKHIVEHAAGVRMIMALDVAFLVLYTGFFAALALVLRGQPFVHLAMGALIATTLLDIVEDHHILSLLGAAEAGMSIDRDALVLQQVLSSTKFTVSYVSLFMFGLAVPRTSKLAWALALFLTVGTLVSAVIGYAAPPALRESLDSGRWIGFLIGFAIAALWLRGVPDRAAQIE